MRILITGAGGFVAGHATTEFLGAGHDVFLTGRFAPPAGHSGPDWRAADLSVPGVWDQLLGWSRPDCILHLAAQSSPKDSWTALRETFDGNLSPTLELIAALSRQRARGRVVYASSSDVYGTPLPADLPLTEDSPVNPGNPYAVSKWSTEMCLRLFADKKGLDVVIARPFSHTGPGQDTRFVVPAFAHQVALVEAGAQESLLHGDLGTWRDFTDVRDVVRAYRLLAEQGVPGATYNICSGRSIRMGDLLASLATIAGIEAPSHTDQGLLRPEAHVRLCGTSERLRNLTGWQPSIPLGQTLLDVLNHQRARVLSSAPDCGR